MDDKPVTDGRNKRLEKSREKVVRTHIDLIMTTGEIPSMDLISEKSGVSRRSVFRIFQKKDELLIQSNELFMKDIYKRIAVPERDESLSLEETIEKFLSYRSQFNEYITPMRRVIESRRFTDPLLKNLGMEGVERQKSLIAMFFGSLLKNHREYDRLEEMLIFYSSWSSWSYLRFDLELTEKESLQRLIDQVGILINAMI